MLVCRPSSTAPHIVKPGAPLEPLCRFLDPEGAPTRLADSSRFPACQPRSGVQVRRVQE